MLEYFVRRYTELVKEKLGTDIIDTQLAYQNRRKIPKFRVSSGVLLYCLVNEFFICFRNRSAIGVKLWYLFQIIYIFISRRGESGRKTSPLSGEVSIRLFSVSRIPRPSFANIEPL